MKFTNYIIGTLFLFTLTVQAQDFWQQTNGPLGGRALALAVHSNGAIFAGTGKHGLLCSKDNGEHWFRLVNGLPPPKYHFKFALTINDSGDIFAGYLNSIFRSSDGGKTWIDTNFGDYVYSLGINSKHHIFAGTLGAIYRSTDNGRRWLRVYQMSDTFFYAIAIDSNDRIFAGTYGDVPALYRSTDNGQNWIQTNLKNQPVKALLIDGNDTIFAGTAGQGVFRSEDQGQTWAQINNGLANFPVLEIESFAYNTNGDIFVGGNIGGVYMSTDSGDH